MHPVFHDPTASRSGHFTEVQAAILMQQIIRLGCPSLAWVSWGAKGGAVFKDCLDVAVAVALALLVILSGAPLATLTKESYKILISSLGTFFRILRKPSQEFSILRDGYSNLQLSVYPHKQPGLYNLQTFVGGCFPAFTSGEWPSPRVNRIYRGAIYYMHENQVCHRDLKPENFLFMTKDLGITNHPKGLNVFQRRPALFG